MANILVVDDKELMRDSLQATLDRDAHDVLACGSALEALEILDKTL